MQISGLIKQSLMEYPDILSCVIFTQGCNLRCPYCHNIELIDNKKGILSEKEVFFFLEKNKNLLDGVVITGGECTIQSDLIPFIEKIKELNLLVKIDTNGTNPTVIKKLIDKNLINYIAMDIKSDNEINSFTKNSGVKSIKFLENINQTIKIILQSGIKYEFRTTIAKELLSIDNILKICEHIKHSKQYFLQNVISKKYNSIPHFDLLEIKSKYKFVKIRD